VKDRHQNSLSYRDAGVDIEAGNRFVDRVKSIAARTRTPGVITDIGGFGGLFELPVDRYEHPVLVTGTDGVGTKLRLAIDADIHDTVGIDLVAMCVNDILVSGARPLFFLDYLATGRLDVRLAEAVAGGIGRGCELAGVALIGGETAEMPGMYAHTDYDLAGFCVGIVERADIIDASRVSAGDAVIGLASSGAHSNGFSLIRKVMELADISLDDEFEQSSFARVFLEPTRIYVNSILELVREVPVCGLAHITGGGLTENIPRVLPEHTRARLDPRTWSRPELFRWLQETGGITDDEMYRTFNCGVGFVVIVAPSDLDETIRVLERGGETATVIGHIEQADEPRPEVLIE